MSSISCTEFNRLFEQAVESRLPVDTPELRGHATLCAECRAAWLDALLLDGALAEWRKSKQTLSTVDLTDVVLFRRTAALEAPLSVGPIPATAADSRRGRRWLSRRTAAIAAGVLATTVCVVLFSGRLSPRSDQRETARHDQSSAPQKTTLLTQTAPRVSPVPAIRPAAAQKALAKPVAEAPVEMMVQDAESAYFDLASEAAQAVAAATVLVPRPASAVATAPEVDANGRWVDDVGRQFEPVSKNLSQAFQFLMEAVPAEKAPAT